MEVIVIGCGDLGRRVAAAHAARGDTVTGTVRGAGSATVLRTDGLKVLQVDFDTHAPMLPRADVVYHFMPPPRDGDTDPRTENLLAVLPPCGKLVYASTTAVYGDADGSWIDEDTPPAPGTARGRRRLDAERRLAHWGEANGVPVVILRIAAIYGPGRLPRSRSARGDVPVNRIHVDDLAAACVAAADRGVGGRVYDCADGAPVTQDAFLETLARLGGPDLRGAPRVGNEFLSESKRIRARRIRDELGVELRYPNHEAGLQATLHNGA